MKLTIYNGSPRAKKSNTCFIINYFIKGFKMKNRQAPEVAYLIQTKQTEEFLQLFKSSDKVILAFPLYFDAMPANVKSFIEQLAAYKNTHSNPDMGFIVQSGFPEAIHSRAIEQYLEKLTQRLNCRYLGTVIKGNVEGIQKRPAYMDKKWLKKIVELGKNIAENDRFDENIIQDLSKPEKFSKMSRFFLTIAKKTGFLNTYWNQQLRKNKAYKKRFDKPYQK